MQPLSERARGRWPVILAGLGLDRRFLRNRHGECPFCGGKDRYRFDDKGDGRYYCSGCGPGNGIDLAKKLTGSTSFKEVAARIDPLIGTGPAAPFTPASPSLPDRKRLKRMWTKESSTIRPDDAAGLWLAKRAGVTAVPSCLRYHPRLFHGATKTLHPAMLARVQAPDGSGCQIHRTYLSEVGNKAAVTPQRAMMPGSLEEKGAAIRLFPNVEKVLGVGEGIETCFAAASLFDVPVWSVLNVGGFKDWRPPAGVEEVIVFADNDANGVGQSGAFALAAELALERYRARVEIPATLGADWRDVWSQSCTP